MGCVSLESSGDCTQRGAGGCQGGAQRRGHPWGAARWAEGYPTRAGNHGCREKADPCSLPALMLAVSGQLERAKRCPVQGAATWARSGCAGLCKAYIISALLNSRGREERPALRDWAPLFSEENRALLLISCPDSGCRGWPWPWVPRGAVFHSIPTAGGFPDASGGKNQVLMCVKPWERALWLSWMLQQVGGGSLSFPLAFAYTVLERFRKQFPASSCGVSMLPLWEGALCRHPSSLLAWHPCTSCIQRKIKYFQNILCSTAEYRMSQSTLAVASLWDDCYATVRELLFLRCHGQLNCGISFIPLQCPVHWEGIT